MILLLAAAAVAQPAAPIDCAAFDQKTATPIAITSVPISPSEMGSDRPLPHSAGTILAFAVGKLEYWGNGISIQSNDPRFIQITLGNSPYLHHPCGYAIDGPTGWNARDKDLSSWSIRFAPQREDIPPASTDAAQHGAAPALPGYEPGQSGRVLVGNGSFFIGLMHRGDRQPETLVVAFPAKQGTARPEILARIPIRFDGLQVLPFLHGPGFDISLAGRDPDGTLHRANLTLTGPEADRLGADFAKADDGK